MRVDKPTNRRISIAEIRSTYSIRIDDKGGFGREHDANRIMFIRRVSLLLSVDPLLLQRYRSDVISRETKMKSHHTVIVDRYLVGTSQSTRMKMNLYYLCLSVSAVVKEPLNR